jgi:hypothetical protein
MVVCYFNVEGVSVFPEKADSPLIVDPDTVLPPAIAFQSLEPVARWDPEVLNVSGPVKIQELSPGTPLNRAKLRHILVTEQLFCFCIAERPDHRS